MPVAILLSVVLGLAAWGPGVDGSGATVAVLACLGVGGAATLAVLAARDGRRAWAWDARWGYPLAALLAWMAIQALNASHRFVPESRALIPLPHVAWLPRGVDRATVLGALVQAVAYGMTFWLARCWLSGRRERLFLVLTQVLCGVAMAVLVLQQRQGPPPGAQYPLTGTVVNSNQYAAYANVMLALGIGWIGECLTAVRNRWLSAGVCGLLVGAVAVLLASVARSGSRMGVLVAVVVVVAGLIAAGRRGGWYRRVLLTGLVAGIAMLVAWAGARGLQGCEGGWSGRLMAANAASRLGVQRAVLAMVPDRWLAGFGAGTFEQAFPFYQPDTLRGAYRHAHNEYLQALVEFGIGGVLLLAGVLLAAGWRPVRAGGWGPLSAWERRGILLALGALALHALTDFPFRMPMVSLVAAALLGMSGGQLAGERGGMRKS